jgi:hypothetical protein
MFRAESEGPSFGGVRSRAPGYSAFPPDAGACLLERILPKICRGELDGRCFRRGPPGSRSGAPVARELQTVAPARRK